MKLGVSPYLSWVRGSLKTWDMVVCGQGGDDLYARAKVKPRQPATSEKVKAASFHTLATRVWPTLTDEERETWVRFAQTWAQPGKRPRRGMDVCREAARMRCTLRLEPVRQAPELPYPAKVTDMQLEATADPNEFRLRVEHGIETPAGYVLMVRITPQRNAGRTPTAAEARCICGVGPASAAPLPVSGGTVVFRGARYAVQPGGKVGLAATIVRVADGLASPEVFFVRYRPTTAPPP